MNNPYQNQFNPYANLYQPYGQVGYQNQPYRQAPEPVQQTTAILSGRTVLSDKEITPNETPSNGSFAYFPLSDGSCIYAKCLNSNGIINTIKYVPIIDAEEENQSPSELDAIIERLDGIEAVLKKMTEPKKTTSRATKKETTNE